MSRTDATTRALMSGQATGEVQLDVRRFTVGALRGAGREWIGPEIVDVLHMLRIVFELTNQTIVIAVRIVAQASLTLQDDHRHGPAECASLKSAPMRFVALNDGASSGFCDTECSVSTCSSEGTPMVTRPAIANHARMMGTDSRWIVRATNGRLSGS